MKIKQYFYTLWCALWGIKPYTKTLTFGNQKITICTKPELDLIKASEEDRKAILGGDCRE